MRGGYGSDSTVLLYNGFKPKGFNISSRFEKLNINAYGSTMQFGITHLPKSLIYHELFWCRY